VGPAALGPTAEERARLRVGLAIGKVDSAYEVFAGGERLGGVGALPPGRKIDYDRHAIYFVPATAIERGGRLVIALRTWKSEVTSPSTPAPVEGPFRLGPIDTLTRDAFLAELPALLFAVLFVVAGMYHLQLFRHQPELREYLWFGLVAIGAGVYTLLRSQWKYALSDDFVRLKDIEHTLLYVIAILFVQFLWPFLSRPISRPLRVYQAPGSSSAVISRQARGSAQWLQVTRASAGCPQVRWIRRTGATSFLYVSPQLISVTRTG